MQKRVGICDYKMGNLFSIQKALEHFGWSVEFVNEAWSKSHFDLLVLPGMGGFEFGMKELRARHLLEPIRRWIAEGRPFLGVCLGMQLLFSESEEFGSHQGLDIYRGRVRKLKGSQGSKIPHVGWNHVTWTENPDATKPSGLLRFSGIPFYFVHSYVCESVLPFEARASSCVGDDEFLCAFKDKNTVATQFHPEKSGFDGLSFLEWVLNAYEV